MNQGYYLRPLTVIVWQYCQSNSKYIIYDEGVKFYQGMTSAYMNTIYGFIIEKNHVFVLVITFFQMFEDERVKVDDVA